ncbi:MAG: DUF2254 family protein [Egibacteraceae bacterium]
MHLGIQQLVDVALGSLAQGAGDVSSAYEVMVHLELVLRELLWRDLPPVTVVDADARRLEYLRDFSFADYVGEAFDRLRQAAAAHPQVAVGLLDIIGSLAADLEAAGLPRRSQPLWRQARLVLASAEAAEGVLDEDLAPLRRVAGRYGLTV